MINPEHYFYTCDGTIIRNIEELFQSLQDMPDHVFNHHVNSERNDFHNWIKDVHENHGLAKNVKKAKNQDDMLKHVFVSLFS